MKLVRTANRFHQTILVLELLGFEVEKTFFAQAKNRNSFSRFVKFSREGVEIFEF